MRNVCMRIIWHVMKHKYMLMCILVSLCLAAGFSSLMAQEEAGVTVDAATITHEISPYVYGANFGPYSVITIDLFEEAANSGITFLRYPGGRWGDQNNIQSFHIDMYMRIIALMNATPSIHVRLEGGTPEQAANLVRMVNIDNDHQVRHWYIGNEPSLFNNYTVARYVEEWRAIAEAMRAVDPDIILIGPEVHQWNGTPQVDPRDPEGVDWLRGFLRANGDIVDVVAVHRYPFPRSQANPVTTIEELRANGPEWGVILERLRAVILEETGRDDLPVAVTEVNSHWSNAVFGEAAPNSPFHAIWWADALGRLIQDDPYIVGFFDLQSLDGRGGWGLLARDTVRPTYYVYQLYQRFGNQMVVTHSTIEYLSVFGALRDDGALTLIAVNRGDDAISTTLDITGFDGTVTETRLLTADVLAEVVDEVLLDGTTLTMPGRSAALFVLEQ